MTPISLKTRQQGGVYDRDNGLVIIFDDDGVVLIPDAIQQILEVLLEVGSVGFRDHRWLQDDEKNIFAEHAFAQYGQSGCDIAPLKGRESAGTLAGS
jgi:GT2 family glycosyltransferase